MQNSTNLKTSEKITSLANEVYRIANNNPSGFTLNIETMQHINSGYVAAYKETQNNFGFDGLKNALHFALLIGASVIGGWFNTDKGQFYFDCSCIFENEAEAATFGIENEQIAIFDLNNCKEITL